MSPLRERSDLYESLRMTWPELPDASVVVSWRMEERVGTPAVLEVEVRRFVDGLYMTAFQDYDLVKNRQSR